MRGIFKKNYSLAKFTSWKIGGVAEYFYQPKNLADLAEFLRDWQKEPITVLGAGSNVLIRDGGILGLTIYLRDALCNSNNFKIEGDNTAYRVGAGEMLQNFVHVLSEDDMAKAMFLAGIPGTVGGALAMNAGAYGDFIWNYVVAVETIDRKGLVRTRKPTEFKVSYRNVSGLIENQEWFSAATFRFTCDTKENARQLMLNILQKRRNAQPLDEPSCGSVFRNPEGDYAARLIEASNLKGKRFGDAEISMKHANFIVNKGNATAKDVEALMDFIQKTVLQEHGVKLIPEVKILGHF